MKRFLLAIFLLFAFLPLVNISAAEKEYMPRASDSIAQEELTAIATATEEALSDMQEVTPTDQPIGFSIFGWFQPKDSEVQLSSNTIIAGGESRATIGTPNSGESLETIKIYTDSKDLAFKYNVKLDGQEWEGEKTGLYDLAESAGNTETTSSKIKNIILRLDGTKSLDYDLYYRAYSKDGQWQPWVTTNNSVFTTENESEIECLEVRLVPKGSAAPPENVNTQNVPIIMATVDENSAPVMGKDITIGDPESDNILEGFVLETNNSNLGINYQANISNRDWVGSQDSEYVGIEAPDQVIEAVKLSLIGADAGQYDIYYRANVDTYGWLDWANNDQIAGTISQYLPIKALQIRILPKGSITPGNTDTPSVVAYTRQEGEILKSVNKLRLQEGLNLVTGDSKLHEAAQVRVEELATKYSHIRPNGQGGFESVLNTVEYREDGLVPALGESFTKNVDTNKAFENFTKKQTCLNMLTTNYYKTFALAQSDENGQFSEILMSDTPSDYSILY